MEKTEILNKLFDKYKDRFDGSFHNVLWQIMINGKRKDTESCFVSNYTNRGLDLGIADKNESGYTFAGCCFKYNVTYDEAELILADLNKEVFELTEDQAFKISLSSLTK